jgi:hypothetical protein
MALRLLGRFSFTCTFSLLSFFFGTALGEKGTSGGEDVLGILDAACVLVNSSCLIMGEDGEGLLLLAFPRS